MRHLSSYYKLLIVAVMAVTMVATFSDSNSASASHGGSVVCDPGTGHCYQFVSAQTDWYIAKAAAEAMTHDGVSGHLATITSDAETDFIVANFPVATGGSVSAGGWAFFGGFRELLEDNPDPGNIWGPWQWVTGEPFGSYEKFAGGEPSGWDHDGDGSIGVLQFFHDQGRPLAGTGWTGGWNGFWNDANPSTLHGSGATGFGYLVEFDAPECVSYDFSDSLGLTINGDAHLPAGVDLLRLTTSAGGQGGSAFSTNTIDLANAASFSTEFSFRIHGNGNGGADGLAFVIQPNGNNVGSNGGGLGYQGVANSLAIEFDTWNNGVVDDHSDNHVGISLNGNIDAVVQANVPTLLEGGGTFHVWVDYDGNVETIEVRVATTDARPATPLLSYSGLDLEAVLGQTNAFVGFSGATGSAYSTHDVLDWEFCSDVQNEVEPPNADPTITADSSAVVIDEGDVAGNSGSFADSDGDSVTITKTAGPGTVSQAGSSWSWTNVAAPDDAYYSVTIQADDGEGGTAETTFTVTVDNVDPVLDSGVVDLNTWTLDNPGSGTWTVAPGGNSVYQSINGNPTFFVSDFEALGSPLSGSIKVDPNWDDDFIGFAIGFEPGDSSSATADFLLVDWKQGTQAGAPAGLAVSRVTGPAGSRGYWLHDGGVAELARGSSLGSTGWVDGQEYDFQFEFDSSRIKVFVDGNLEIDVAHGGGAALLGGRFAFYNFSQEGVRYSAVQSDSISGFEGDTVNLTKGFTDAGSGDTHIATIDWDGLGTVIAPAAAGSGAVTGSYEYADDGTYTVTVTVCDDDGGCDTDTVQALIANVSPDVDVNNESVTVNEGQTAANSGSYDDPGADDVTFTASVGSVTKTGVNDGTWSWSFDTDDGPAESQTVTITANDGDGGITEVEFDLTVVNLSPEASLSNNGPVTEGTLTAEVSFSGESDASDADEAAGFTYSFDIGDDGSFEVTGSASSSTIIPAALLADGHSTVPVRGRITDKDGGSTEYVTTVEVTNVDPSVADIDDQTIVAGETVEFSTTFSDPGNPEVFTGAIDWDGAASTTPTLGAGTISGSAVVNLPGVYNVVVSVFDGDDGVGTAEFTLTVRLDIDVKPDGDSDPSNDVNPLNSNGNGVVPIAVLGNADFDVTTLDPSSARAGYSLLEEYTAAPYHDGHIEDVNGDGYADLLLHFREWELGVPLDGLEPKSDILIELTIDDADSTYVGDDKARVNPNNRTSKGKNEVETGGKGGPKDKKK